MRENATCCCLLILCAVAAVMDLRHWKIWNPWLYGWAAAGFVCRILTGAPVTEGIFGFLLPLLLLGWLYFFRMMGAGDLKLFSAIGVWLGMDRLLDCMLFSFLAAGGMALVSMLVRRNLKERFACFGNYMKRLLRYGIKTDYLTEESGKARIPLSVPVLAVMVIKAAEVCA